MEDIAVAEAHHHTQDSYMETEPNPSRKMKRLKKLVRNDDTEMDTTNNNASSSVKDGGEPQAENTYKRPTVVSPLFFSKLKFFR